ncbi:MAG: cbb3-type cytochrome oxidase assembly protein CcoS [Pseudomonadota bacterium]
MQILVFLIPVSLILGAIGVAAFLWAVKNKQFDDLEGDGARVLIDREPD